MEIKILGCGTSSGVPLLHCQCRVCHSSDPKNKRLRCSAWIQVNQKHFVIDTGPDFRQQAFSAGIPRIDAVLYTHPHADHTHGIDELRSFNYIQKETIPVYGNQWTSEELPMRFSYVFGSEHGDSVPHLKMHEIDLRKPFVEIMGQKIIPLPVPHGKKETLGYRFGSFAYVTDCHLISDETLSRMKDLSVLILDCVRLTPHSTHLHLEASLEIISKLKPKKTYLTHLGHDFDYSEGARLLPKDVEFAYDGLSISCPQQ